MSDSWKLTIPCTRAEAEALHDDVPALALLDPAPTLVTRELEDFNDDAWELDAYFNGKPDAATVQVIQSLLPSAAKAKPQLERLPDADWLTVSQAGIDPVHAGRFYVHTESNRGQVPDGAVPFRIEASRAFGTGNHETTYGCLAMLDRLKARGMRADHVADIGTGTGLLAFAARHLWPRAYVTASDIDPESIDVTVDNAAANAVPLGQHQGRVALCVAAGTDHEMIARRAPYDLVIANILAGPLIALAPALARVTREGGTLLLAGLLNTQADTVVAAYRTQGFRLAERRDTGDWPVLRFVKRARHGWRRPLRIRDRQGRPPDGFGAW
jgi:ribosomal protein L11 methyltransferase